MEAREREAKARDTRRLPNKAACVREHEREAKREAREEGGKRKSERRPGPSPEEGREKGPCPKGFPKETE